MRQLVRSVVFLTAWLGLGPVFGATGQIVFSANLGTDGSEIYVVSPDGNALTQLTDSPEWDGEPAWSPDGSRIAFSSARSGDRDIFVMNADGSGVVTAVGGPGDQSRPSWSPDGSSLAYVSTERYLGYLGAPANVFITNINTGQSGVLGDYLAGPGRPVWSPDSDRIIFSTPCTECAEYSTNIVSVGIEGNDRIDVTSGQDRDAYPALSPNGTTVLFIREPAEELEQADDDPVAELWSVNSDGSGPQRIRSDLSGGTAPTISPDGRRIVLENSTCLGTPVCLLDSFNGRPATLFDGGPPSEGPALNMDTPDWGCCPGPGRGGVTLPRASSGATTDESSPSPLTLEAGGSTTSMSLNAPGVTVAVSELWGGGFQNMLVKAGSKLLMAGDNSGVHALTSGQWAPSSANFIKFQQSREVASIAVHPNNSSKVWAATSGGLYYSSDGGEDWERKTDLTNSQPVFRGNNNGGGASQGNPLYPTHPRATGQLLVFEGGNLYAASATDGLWRGDNTGGNMVRVALADHYLRSLVQHPTTSGLLYVASLGKAGNTNVAGIYEVDCRGGGCISTKVSPNELKTPEELVFGGDRLWCACGLDGVWRTAKNDFDNWENFSKPDILPPDEDRELPLGPYNWSAIDVGDFDGTGSFDVVAGAVVDGSNTPMEVALQWTPLITVDWKNVVTDPAAVETQPVCGTAGNHWWVADPQHTLLNKNLLAHEGWDTGFVKFVDDELYITGRSGAWRMKDNANPAGSLEYEKSCAFVKGLSSTANRAIDAGPPGATNNHVIIGNTDFDALSSTNGLKAITTYGGSGGIVQHIVDGNTVGYDVDYNTGDAAPYALIGAGGRDKANVGQGDVFEADAEDHEPVDLELDLNYRIVGVGAATQPFGSKARHEVAVVSGLENPRNNNQQSPDRGIWYRSPGGPQWAEQMSTVGNGSRARETDYTRVPIEWGRNNSSTGYSKFVFLLDRDSGIWRSDNWGQGWQHIWAPNNLNAHFPTNLGSGADYVGFMAVNPDAQKNELVFTSALGLFKIGNATSCNSCAPSSPFTPADMPEKLGPVAFDPSGDHLVVVSRVMNEENSVNVFDKAEIWVNSESGFVKKVGDDSIFNSAAFALTDMAITESGDIFLSSRGQGVLVVSGAVPPTP